MHTFKDRLSILIPDSVAEKVVEVYGSPRNLFSATEGEMRANGVPKGSARRLAAMADLCREAASERLKVGARFRSGSDIFKHYHHRLRELKVEQFWTVLLDGKNRVMGEVMTSQGSLTASLVHPREVFAPAIKSSAGALVFVHNHPSGDPTPSVEDVEITRRLCAVADLVGIRVLDHVVVGDGSYVSFLERGLLGTAK
jgi:DNA repair protein RadC